jgi:hypothetical protein
MQYSSDVESSIVFGGVFESLILVKISPSKEEEIPTSAKI